MPRDKGDEYSRESSNKDAGLEALARFLDTRFSLFGIRFGFDSLIGLVPGVGDAQLHVDAQFFGGTAVSDQLFFAKRAMLTIYPDIVILTS